MSAKPLVLWGPPGVGKTTVGLRCARLLGWDFLDLDAELARVAGASIPALLAHGEEHFRAQEAAVARQLLRGGRRVIALGGGALLDPALRAEFQAAAELVRLDAGLDTLCARLGPEAGRRPLLQGPDLRGAVAALLLARHAAYQDIPRAVPTDDRSPDQAAAAVLRVAFPAVTHLVSLGTASHPYSLGPGLLDTVGTQLRALGAKGRAFLLGDARVLRRYGRQVLASLKDAGLAPLELGLPAGEDAKDPRRLLWILRNLGRVQADRGDYIVALGGGAALDAAGLAAALYMRGLPLVLLPTTALAMLDAALGGKTAINEQHTKNLYGTFYAPSLVLADTATLASLPRRELRAASAEAVKSALLGDPGLLDLIERERPRLGTREADPAPDLQLWAEVIERSARVKIEIVRRDPFEKGERKLLNLGHTLGHALERCAPGLSHGEAVALGMRGALWLSTRRQRAEPGLEDRVNGILDALGHPRRAPTCKPYEVRAALSLDKKRDAGQLTFILPVRAGLAERSQAVSQDDLFAALDLLGVPGVAEAKGKPKVRRLFRKPKRHQPPRPKTQPDAD